jgi:mannosyl-glycoprotein endo-beta-N-acetylglucosaminidase
MRFWKLGTSTLISFGMALLWATCVLAQLPGQPYTSYWHPNDLLSWSPATDPDADFNRSNVALVDRFLNGDTQVNAHARPDEARVAALSIMYPSTSGSPSQGADVFDVYAFNYWQYIDVLVMWGGSAGEGLILSPSADVIDAGHRNGVAVYGTIFFPPTVYGGQIQWVWDLVQQDGPAFPVADKLIEVAEYYGFDGWFINQETAGGDSTLAGLMRDFMEYIQLNSDVRIMWYDAMTESGSISWQNALNDNNDMFFEDGGRISDEMFLNFWWTSGGLTNSRNHAIGLGRDPYDLYAGVDVQANGYFTGVNWDAPFPEGEPHKVSLGFYCPNWTFTSASTNKAFYRKAFRFWSGANRDPSNTDGTASWPGIAHFIPAFSPINDIPFVTNFNTGQGHLYAVNGEVVKTGDWHNRSLQDILPTWRWIAESSGEPLRPDMNWDDAYYGGTCLEVHGVLDPANTTHLKLFKTRLAVTPDVNLSIAYKTGSAGTATNMEVGLAFEDNPAAFEFFDVGTTASDGWNTSSFELGAHAGRTIAVVSLRFESATSQPDYSILIGRVAVVEGSVDTPAPPSGLHVDAFYPITGYRGTLRLKWDHSPDTPYAYNVYRVNPDLSRTYLGATPNNAYFVTRIDRVGTEAMTTIEVETVGQEFGFSAPDTTTLHWGPATSAEDAPPSGVVPNDLRLNQNTPNPFNPVTDIRYGIPAGTDPSRVVMNIYDTAGRRVTTLVDAEQGPGTYATVWDGTNADGMPVASGVYFCRITWNGKTETRRMVLLK